MLSAKIRVEGEQSAENDKALPPIPHTGGDSPLIVGHVIFEHLARGPPTQFRHPLGKRHPQFGGGFWGEPPSRNRSQRDALAKGAPFRLGLAWRGCLSLISNAI